MGKGKERKLNYNNDNFSKSDRMKAKLFFSSNRFNAGKYKGHSLESVHDDNYLEWVVENIALDEFKIEIISNRIFEIQMKENMRNK